MGEVGGGEYRAPWNWIFSSRVTSSPTASVVGTGAPFRTVCLRALSTGSARLKNSAAKIPIVSSRLTARRRDWQSRE